MNFYDDNFNEDTTEKMMKSAQNISQKGTKKAKKIIKRKFAQIGTKIIKALGKAILTTIKALLPYLLIIGGLLLAIVLGYFMIFEFTGTEKEYFKKYENEITKTENGIYKTSEAQMNMENKTVRDFYRYFAGQSYWKLIGKNNEKLYSPDEKIVIKGEEVEVKDWYKREDMFKIPPNLLYSLDEYMYNWKLKYPEQFIKPVNYNKEDLSLAPLTDKNGLVIVESEEENVKTGEKTGKTILSVRDYGLASVLKYNEKKDYTRKLKVKGEYISKDVWNPETKQVEKIDIKPEPFEFVMKGYPVPIWIIDKAVLVTGEIEYEYEEQDTKFDDLVVGVTNDEKEPKTEVIYDYHYEPNCEEIKTTDPVTGLISSEMVCGEPTVYELKKYRSNDSAIFEELPVVVNTITNNKSQDYLYDYLHNFETYVPEDVITDFDFKDRIDYDSYVFDYDAILTDDYGFDLGSGIGTEQFARTLQYREIVDVHSQNFGVDPFIVLAIITQESGGRNPSNGNGIMQITGGERTITATNVYGEQETFTIKQYEKIDPDKAIKFGVMYIKNLIDEMDGNPYKAIQAYNLGTGTMSTIKKLNPEAWNSNFGWMVYREAARRQKAPDNRPSASYGCMAFPEGEITNGLPPWGDSCYLENVLRYYAGNDIEKIETGGNSIYDRLKILGTAFMKFIKEREKDELIPKVDFINHAKETKVSDVLITTKALDNEILFSEAGIGDYDELNFWDENFMDSIGTAGLSLQELMNIAPNEEGYFPPIILGNGVAITSKFGKRAKPTAGASSFHRGVDIGAPLGTPFYATASGKVTTVGWQPGGAGLYIKINHGNGIETLYMHLSKSYVKEGEQVTQGQNIGAVGSTGVSTGPHLHFELRKNGISIDPISIVKSGNIDNNK